MWKHCDIKQNLRQWEKVTHMGGKVGEEHAGRAKHGEASVHELSLLVPGESGGVLALR